MGINRIALILLTCLLAPFALAQQTVTGTSPAAHDTDGATNTQIEATFNQAMQGASANSFAVHGNFSGRISGNYSGAGTDTLSFIPGGRLKSGERVDVTLTDSLLPQSGTAPTQAHVFRFRAAAGTGPATFNNYRTFGSGGTYVTRLGDVDGDGDLDAVFSNSVYENDGLGNFTLLTAYTTATVYDIALGDVDGDGDLDIATANDAINQAWLNDGTGNFPSSVDIGGNEYSYAIELGDMDGDGDLDAVVGNRNRYNSPPGAQNYVYYNDGQGNFTAGVANLGPGDDVTKCLALGDLDNDGDLDVACGNGDINNATNAVYLNDNGNFSTTRYLLGSQSWPRSLPTWYMDMGDMDGDGDLDVICANFGLSGDTNYVYFNDGQGNFNAGETGFDTGHSTIGLRVADMDGDGDLDILSANNTNYACYVHINDGQGGIASSISLGNSANASWGIDAGDLDGDGDLDILEGNNSGSYYLWLNGQTAASISVTSNGSAVNPGDTLNVAHNDTLSSLNLQLNVDDADGDDVSLSAVITNLTTQGISVGEFESASANSPYSLSPSSGSFSVGSVTHTVALTAADGSGEISTLSFDIVVGTPQQALITVRENSGSGAAIANRSVATGARDLGSVTLGNAASFTVYIENTGNADLNLGLPQLGGVAAADYSFDISNFTSTVAPSGSTSFDVIFTPGNSGVRDATVSFTHDATNTGTPFSFDVTGLGVSAGGSVDTGSGDGGSSGGGCVAHGSGAAWWLFGLLIALVGISATRRRRA